ncbi:hypothetical protein [Ruminococcus difficilis]|uniref:Uncharacterized protein n=1 Tax=Ruminococcus difficilis TaxID=2763069 RepID=A0A934WUT0_9FIRM|nr:hypothetical protein [Ruminococcus difficilis]MBK6090311.1 hypothetical protein [Ruminococcus difficilis]
MSNHDDFVDEFIEYQIFGDSMKNFGGGNSRKPNKGSGCGTTAVIIVLIIIVLAVFGSCGKSNQKSYPSGSYQRSYNNSSSSYSGNSSKSGSSESSCLKKPESSTVQPTTKKNTYNV